MFFKYNIVVFLFSIALLPPLCKAEILFPVKHYDLRGQVTDQSLEVVQLLEQQAYDDNWDSYLEFYPDSGKYRGYFIFNMPLFSDVNISEIKLLANYRGPEVYYQKWFFKLRDFQARKWINIASNAKALPWQWLNISALITENPQRFINTKGQIKLLYQSNNSSDASQLDYLALDVLYALTNPPVTKGISLAKAPMAKKTWWQPAPGLSWKIQLSSAPDSSLSVDVLDVDLFDTSAADITQLKSKGKHVICYFSAGSVEDWRPDVNVFPDSVIGNDYEGWEGEAWLDIRRQDLLLPIMETRIKLAADKGCDAVDPDNVNSYTNNTGFNLTYDDQISYNKALAALAHQSNLAIGLKNDLEQVNDLLDYFDFSINESCFEYNECALLEPFIAVNKAVYAINYATTSDGFCSRVNALNFDGIQKNWNLDAWFSSCR